MTSQELAARAMRGDSGEGGADMVYDGEGIGEGALPQGWAVRAGGGESCGEGLCATRWAAGR